VYYLFEYPTKTPLLRDIISFFVINRTKYKIGAEANKWSDEQYKNYKQYIENQLLTKINKQISNNFVHIEYECKGIKESYLKYVEFKDEMGDNLTKDEFAQYCSSTQELFKLMGNSINGKCLQRPHFLTSKMKICKGKYCRNDICVCETNGVTLAYKNNGRSLRNVLTNTSIKFSRDLGSTVFALSKRIMYNAINIVGGFYKPVVYYIDTDSLYLEKQHCNMIEKAGLVDKDLPFCFKLNDVEYKKDCDSLITEAYFVKPKTKATNGYYFENKEWNKSDKGRISVKGFRSNNSLIYLSLLRDDPSLTVMDAFNKQDEYNVNFEDIKNLSENKQQLNKYQNNWVRDINKGVLTDHICKKKIEYESNILKLQKENKGIRYPLGYVT
jgi:hypothetical protein